MFILDALISMWEVTLIFNLHVLYFLFPGWEIGPEIRSLHLFLFLATTVAGGGGGQELATMSQEFEFLH